MATTSSQLWRRAAVGCCMVDGWEDHWCTDISLFTVPIFAVMRSWTGVHHHLGISSVVNCDLRWWLLGEIWQRERYYYRDDSWIPSPHSGCSPPTARFGRPRRDPAPSTVTQTAGIAGVNVSLPAVSPPQARPFSTPTSRSPRPPTIVQPTRVSHGDQDDQHLALPSPLFPSDTTPPPFSDASSSSSEPSLDDLDGGVLEDEDALSPADLFYERWAPTILNCSSRTELDTIASDLATNWHALTLKEDTPSSEATRPPRIPQTTPPGSIPHRQQSRQQQRVRRKNNAKRWADASKLQALFKRYPKRAVRKVLGETSQSYTGSSEAATLFLKTTYEQPRPPPDDILVARAAYDECLWAPPSDDDLSLLSLPPSRQEIAYKLKRASNTSPGADGVEYKDIQRLDPSGRLLEILSMVEALSLTSGILPENLHKTSKRNRSLPLTILFKMCHRDDTGFIIICCKNWTC
ncbi:hypothetical protein DAPPUDRAFT_301908 [Daphnia pulex]|uniref:Uncharacterized protein n=1 Tax=Daphnia pulex TaxID=6669 RepID=E9GAG8_DAPPU|nr:hypothetical protein DAPPUDRAFT_301908 [Daphnia pulex]|eukprot:EFX83239.1 hypothetical protein DAPPUDRAFT_301908 [Daphnia pulex]